jgi:two-component system OmpR family sensor kinase
MTRPRWSATPLRVKLVAALVLLVAGALAIGGFAASTLLRRYLVQQADIELVEYAQRYHGPGPGDHGGDPDEPPSRYWVARLDAQGSPAISTTLLTERPDLGSLTAARVQAYGGRPFTVRSTQGSTQWRVVARTDGGGTLVVARNIGEVQDTVRRLGYLELVVGLAVLAALSLLGYLLVRISLAPLVAVEHTAEAIAAGDLSRRVPEADPRTEVGRLSAALNAMLHHVESAFRTREASEAAARESEERMRRFVADASHELRTPLTSIRGFAELYRQGAATAPDEVARVMRRIEDEGARMGLLVEDLLLLARLDEERPLAMAPVDLVTLAVDAVQDARAVAPDRPVELSVSGAPLVVDGDESRLRQVLGNLVGNALAHTPAGTRVTVRTARRDGAYAVVEVADEGPGLSAEDTARVFERFYRADSSRHRGAGGGAGLGLSIVAALVAAHRGTVEVDTVPGEGATFRVVLPLAR